LVPHTANFFDRQIGRVIEHPVEITLARAAGAGIEQLDAGMRRLLAI
jgi:hypothetical protein